MVILHGKTFRIRGVKIISASITIDNKMTGDLERPIRFMTQEDWDQIIEWWNQCTHTRTDEGFNEILREQILKVGYALQIGG